jgi:hypothetical protein
LTQFNIFVENPVNVLTQEESKKFIQGQEKDKYAFFLKVSVSNGSNAVVLIDVIHSPGHWFGKNSGKFGQVQQRYRNHKRLHSSYHGKGGN